MFKYTLTFAIALLMSFSIISCGGNDGPDCDDAAALSQFLTSASAEYNNAFQAFLADPTESNCNAIGDSLDDFYDAIASVSDCIPNEDRESFEAIAESARQSIAALDCDI